MEAVKRILFYLPDIYGLGVGHWRQGVGYGGCLGGHGEQGGDTKCHSGWNSLKKYI
jgi:hypothetical protein